MYFAMLATLPQRPKIRICSVERPAVAKNCAPITRIEWPVILVASWPCATANGYNRFTVALLDKPMPSSFCSSASLAERASASLRAACTGQLVAGQMQS